jgi:hypothetical protein
MYKIDYIETEFDTDCIAIGTHISNNVFRLIISKHDTEIQMLYDDMYISIATIFDIHELYQILKCGTHTNQFIKNRLIIAIMNECIIQKLNEKSC